MRIDDALLAVSLGDVADGDRLTETCLACVAGGADVVVVRAAALADPADGARAAAACRAEESLLLVAGEPADVARWDAHGLHLPGPGPAIGMLRAALGADRLVGMETGSLDEASLALELGADYVVHRAGTGCPAAFAALRDQARVPLYAGGFEGLDEAREIVAAGVFRLWVRQANHAGADMAQVIAPYARLLGRCI